MFDTFTSVICVSYSFQFTCRVWYNSPTLRLVNWIHCCLLLHSLYLNKFRTYCLLICLDQLLLLGYVGILICVFMFWFWLVTTHNRTLQWRSYFRAREDPHYQVIHYDENQPLILISILLFCNISRTGNSNQREILEYAYFSDTKI